MTLRCQKDYAICGYRYDPRKGDPENRIPAGTPLADLPAGWVCLRCTSGNTASRSREDPRT